MKTCFYTFCNGYTTGQKRDFSRTFLEQLFARAEANGYDFSPYRTKAKTKKDKNAVFCQLHLSIS